MKVELWLLRFRGSTQGLGGTNAATSPWGKKHLTRAATEGRGGGRTAVLDGVMSGSSVGFRGNCGLQVWVEMEEGMVSKLGVFMEGLGAKVGLAAQDVDTSPLSPSALMTGLGTKAGLAATGGGLM